MSTPATPLIGSGAAMASLRGLIGLVARSSATVLISGESGTGKELIARALHDQSDRVGGRFVPINCGAIPRELVESELFGHRKGAFTGALADRIGRFELAHGGTIFLDEIGDLPMDVQVKLLRVLQERVVDAIGSSQPVRVDVRVIAATHRDLEHEVAQGRFREDLFYRLNVLPICSPALRERTEDVPELLSFHAQRLARPGEAPIGFDLATLRALQQYPWPGNVRELCNLVDRFTTLFPGGCVRLNEMPEAMLPKGLRAARATMAAAAAAAPPSVSRLPSQPPQADAVPAGADLLQVAPEAGEFDAVTDAESAIRLAQGMAVLPPEGLALKDHLADLERSLIQQALERTRGNVSQTARLLSLQRTTLIEKLHRFDLRAA